jgi:hypothetical protein
MNSRLVSCKSTNYENNFLTLSFYYLINANVPTDEKLSSFVKVNLA